MAPLQSKPYSDGMEFTQFVGLVGRVSPRGVRLSKRAAYLERMRLREVHEKTVYNTGFWPTYFSCEHRVKSLFVLGNMHQDEYRSWVEFKRDVCFVLGQGEQCSEVCAKKILSRRVLDGKTFKKAVMGGSVEAIDVFRHTLEAVKSLLGFLPSFKVNVNADLNELLTPVVEDFTITSLVESMLGRVDDVLGIFKDMAKDFSKFMATLLVIYGLYCIATLYPKAWVVIAPLMAVVWVFVFPDYILRTLKEVMPGFFHGGGNEEQAGVWKPALVVGALLASYFGVTNEVWSSDCFKQLMMVKRASRAADDVEGLLMDCWNVVRSTINVILPFVGINVLAEEMAEHVEFQLEVLEFKDQIESRKRKADEAAVEDYRKLIEKGRGLIRLHATNREMRSSVYNSIVMLLNMAKSLSPAFQNAVNQRQEPIALNFVGPPGIGKSTISQDLHVRLCCHHFDGEKCEKMGYDFKSEMYIPGVGDYDEGYTGQFTWMEDDFGQALDAPYDKNSRFVQMVKYVNSIPASMNMAFESKGTVFFDSKLILMSSNTTTGFYKDAKKVLKEPECLDRRIMTFRVALDPEMSKPCPGNPKLRVIDGAKCAEDVNLRDSLGDYEPPDYWTFTPVEFCSGNEIPRPTPPGMDKAPPLRYRDIVEMVKKKFDDSQRENVDRSAQLVKLAHKLKGVTYVPLEKKKEEPLTMFGRLFATLKRFCAAYVEKAKWLSDKVVTPWFGSVDKATRKFVSGITSTAQAALKYLKEHCRVMYLAVLFGSGATLLFGAWKAAVYILTGVCKPLFESCKDTIRQVREKGLSPYALEMRQKVLSMFSNKDFDVEDGKPIQLNSDSLRRIADRLDGEVEAKLVHSEPAVASKNVVDMWQMLKKNIVGFYIHQADGKVFRMANGLMLSNSVCLYPYHYDYMIPQFPDVVKITVRRLYRDGDKERVCCTFQSIDRWRQRVRYVDKVREVVFADLPCIGFPSIAHCFPKRQDFPAPHCHPFDVQVIRSFTSVDGTDTEYMAVKARYNLDLELSKNTPEERVVKDVVNYSSVFAPGDCGSLVLRTDAHGCTPLLGIHIAGTPASKIGWGTMLSQEYVVDCVSKVSPQRVVVQSANYGAIVHEKGQAPMDDESFLHIGELKEGASFIPVKTKRVPTKLQEDKLFGEPTRRPAVIDPNSPLQPMRKAIEKYAGQVEGLPVQSLKKAAQGVFKNFLEDTALLRERAKIRSNIEAVTGRLEDGTQLLPGLNRSSSPGFPYNLCGKKGKGKASKKTMFGSFDYDFTSPECKLVFERVDQIIEDAKSGKRSITVFTDFLKDELRPHDRVDTGKTRLISGGPVEYTIACRRLFMDFIHAFESQRIGKGSGMFPSIVGINPYSEYDDLARHIKGVGDKFIAGDFSSYDGSEQPDIHNILTDVICSWYCCDVENNVARRILLLEMSNSHHLGGLGQNRKTLYMWLKSLPSGHPLTCIINTMYNMLVFYWAFMMLCPGEQFWKHVRAAYFGDDNLHGISDAVIDRFNQLTLTAKLRELGLTYTDESKSDSVDAYKSFEEVGILKRTFRKTQIDGQDVYLAPLNLTSILEAMYWWKPKDGVTEADYLEDQANIFLREMSLHPFEIWSEYVPKTVQYMKDNYGVVLDFEPESYSSYLYQQRETLALTEQVY